MMSCSRSLAKVEMLSKSNPFFEQENLPEPPRPDISSIPKDVPSLQKIEHIQKILDVLSYNHLPHTFFNLDKHRALQSVLLTAKEIIAEALPIRCLEATFVGLYLTQDLQDVERIPLAFKSFANGAYYRHIVLLIRTNSVFGVLGLSRKRTLMYKPMVYTSIFDVVMDFKKAYEAIGHSLVDMKIGIYASHDSHSRILIMWRYVALRLSLFCSGAERATDTGGGGGSGGGGDKVGTPVECDYSPLREFLAKYAKLLPAISDQYYKGVTSTDMHNCSRGTRLCFVDLDNAGGFAAVENARRVECIMRGQSPLSQDARRAAHNRQLDRQPGRGTAVRSSSVASRGEGEGLSGRAVAQRGDATAAEKALPQLWSARSGSSNSSNSNSSSTATLELDVAVAP